jgi:hypothetical protein
MAAHDRGDAGEGVSVGKKEGVNRMECIRPLVLNRHSPLNIERYLKSHTCGHVSFVKIYIFKAGRIYWVSIPIRNSGQTKQSNVTGVCVSYSNGW